MKIQDAWICDHCGEEIAEAKDGWLEWKCKPIRRDGRELRWNYDFRIVHHSLASPREDSEKCYYPLDTMKNVDGGTVSDMHLDHMNGHDGLIKLLEMIHYDLCDAKEVISIIRRIFIPGYELARDYFVMAASESVFEPNSPPDFHGSHQIELVVDWLKRRNE